MANFANYGFGSVKGSSKGKTAEVKTPKVYDFTRGKRPTIPPEEQVQSQKAEKKENAAGARVPQPEFYDFNKKR